MKTKWKGTFNMENDKEQILEMSDSEKTKKRSLGKGRIKKTVSKLISFIKRKTEPAREFLRAGIPGGMIAVTFLATVMNTYIIQDYTYDKIPWIAGGLVTSVLFVTVAELVNLVMKLLFGAGKRCKSYLFLAV